MGFQRMRWFVLLLVCMGPECVEFARVSAAADNADAESGTSYRVLNENPTPPRMRLRAKPATLRGRADRTRILSAIFSPDGTSVTTIDGKGRLVRWDLNRPGQRKHLFNLKRELACAVLSPDGRWLAFADQDGTAAMIELATKSERLRVDSPSGRTVALAFSNGGNLLVGVTETGHIHLHTSDGTAVALAGHMVVPRSVLQTAAFSPDGEQLAVASFSSEVRLFDLVSTSGVKVLKVGESRVSALAFSPAGEQLVVASADGTTRVLSTYGKRQPTGDARAPRVCRLAAGF